ncbi:hypothetical protein FO599_35330, partial [Bacillus thuringiensis]|nr:hypothetical protein [Bacillus thuringiensis]
HTHKGVTYQPDVDRGVFTLDREEIEYMYNTHGVETPEKVYKDLQRVSESIAEHYTTTKMKGLKIDFRKATVVNPR